MTLEPRPARIARAGLAERRESVEIVEYLMDERGPGVRESIEAAVAWLRESRIAGQRVGAHPGAGAPRWRRRGSCARTRRPGPWARFYEIGTNRPMFLGRDGVVRSALADIEAERRTHYSWLGPYAQDLLDREYPAWRTRE